MNKETNTELYFTGVDIGTNTVRCVIGQYNESTGLVSVVGSSQKPNLGMRKGVVVHPIDVAHVISLCVAEAAHQARVQVSGVTTNINGAHLAGHDSKGAIVVSGAGHMISDHDRARVEEAAMALKVPSNYDIVQLFPKNYRVDGMDNIKNPVGMHGMKLEVDTHIIVGSSPALHNLSQSIKSAGFVMHNRTVSSLASAEAVLDRRQRESGVAVVDIGAGTTNIAVLEEGEVQLVATIPMGGNHVTNDIAIGLKVDLDLAEKIKLEYSGLRPGKMLESKPVAKDIHIQHNGRKFTIRSDVLSDIVEARMEDLVVEINKTLEPAKRSRMLPAGIIFVGGGSMIPGLVDFARDLLELPVKIGEIVDLNGLVDDINNVEWATAIGLMRLDMSLSYRHQSLPEAPSGFMDMFKRILGK